MSEIWDSEGDRKEWEHAGLKCLILRHPEAGHLCGYVGLSKGHSCYGKDYEDINAEVHGGLTFGRMGDGNRHSKGYWWIGFDCAHAEDISPYWDAKLSGLGVKSFGHGVYRDMDYVTKETESLAEQLALRKEEKCQK